MSICLLYTSTLKEDSQMLEETVVIGYGAVPKRDLTGSVSSLKSEDLLLSLIHI